jgi:hypothetical protein
VNIHAPRGPNPWQSVEFHLINKCANRLKGQICKKPPFSEVYGICLATLHVQFLYSLPYEEEEEEEGDTFIPQSAGSFISLNIFYLLKCAKRIRHKLNKLMKSSPIYNKLQHYFIEHACI